MRDQELELIAALVEGRLEDESEARALIDSGPEYREEYQAQKIAFESLRDMGTASLEETERSALHRDIWTELRRDSGSPTGGWAWYHRWVAVAGAALVLVGLAAVLGQGLGGDSSETFGEIAADLDAEATTTAAGAAGADRAGEAVEETEDSVGTLSAPEAGRDESAPASDGGLAAFYAREAEKVRSGEFTDRLEPYETPNADPDVEDCVAATGLDGQEVVALLTPPPVADADEGRLALVVPEGSELETAIVTFVDLDTCQAVYVDG